MFKLLIIIIHTNSIVNLSWHHVLAPLTMALYEYAFLLNWIRSNETEWIHVMFVRN